MTCHNDLPHTFCRLFFCVLMTTACISIQIIFADAILAGPSFVNKIGMRFVRVNPGSFTMGSPASEPGRKWDERQHQVTLSRGFYMSVTEVTQGQWISLMGGNPSTDQECGTDCPVENVSYEDCQAFIESLNILEKTTAYRLPTEAEWEYACRAGSREAFTNGPITERQCGMDPVLDKVGWYCGNTGVREPVVYGMKLQQVGLKAPNAWELYDMHGNVSEWVLDACKPRGVLHTGVVNDTYDRDKITDPLSVKGPNRIIRGGSWNTSARYCRSANRGSFKPTARRSYLGFRIVKIQ